jgi:hypothetical protein
MSEIAKVEIFDVKEKLPPDGIMILADIGGEWEILMADGTNVGYAWEQDNADNGGLVFYKWLSLGELTKAEPIVRTSSYCKTHDTYPQGGEPCWACANPFIELAVKAQCGEKFVLISGGTAQEIDDGVTVFDMDTEGNGQCLVCNNKEWDGYNPCPTCRYEDGDDFETIKTKYKAYMATSQESDK